MLSRTADHLYWMSRYIERAENTARLLDIAYQTSLQPQAANESEQTWRSLVSISELNGLFGTRYPAINARNVMEFMVADENNLSSILNCLRAARENARAVRGSLTTEVWETMNQTWLEFRRLLRDGVLARDPSQLFEWVKYRSHLSRGVTVGTMLQDEAFHFIRIGSFLERADNTARLLDVKFYRQEQAQAEHDTARDFYYWSAVLRSVSGFEIYRKVYRDVITPERVAELLILRADMPRSLLACMGNVISNLHHVRNDVSADTERFAGKLHADLKFARIEEVGS